MATLIKKMIWAPYSHLIDLKLLLLPFQELMLRIFLALDLLPGQKVLDAGCGTGNICSLLDLKTKGTVFFTGIDASESMINKARAKNLGQNFSWQIADLNQQLPFTNKSFDRVFCCHVLYNLAKPEFSLAEFHRILKPGGILVVATPQTNNPMAVLPEHFRQIFRQKDWPCLKKTCYSLPWFVLLAVYNLILSAQSTASKDFFYGEGELAGILAKANFQVLKIQPAYAGVDILAVAKKGG
ncbi:MAG: class I SAM-dependent methyltransferase [Candidatus Parcubacteria bacterium]|nr:class I SAM-dependent methyltransferase [Candidatus Parcubacteria bacterium]